MELEDSLGSMKQRLDAINHKLDLLVSIEGNIGEIYNKKVKKLLETIFGITLKKNYEFNPSKISVSFFKQVHVL